jgi:hypothetical protein
MSVNLLRNSKVFFTTNVDLKDPDRGKIELIGHSMLTTKEIQVLDDLSFTQTTAVETIAVNEAGTTPIRGQRQFNTALNPVDFNFSTYLRPAKEKKLAGTVTQITAQTTVALGGGTKTFRTWSATDVLTASLQDTYNQLTTSSTFAISSSFGKDTTVQVALPLVGSGVIARPLILAPIFGTDPVYTDTFEKLVGFRIVDGGAGYSSGAAVVNIFDPDAASEGTEVISINIGPVTPPSTAVGTSCEEADLWNAMFSKDETGVINQSLLTNGIDDSNGAFKTVAVNDPSRPAVVKLENSNSHQLKRFGIIVVFDQNTFLLDDCSLTQASIDFGIDQIATIQWSGQARAIRRIDSPKVTIPLTGSIVESGGEGQFDPPGGGRSSPLTGKFKGKITDAPFIANKLSTVTLHTEIGKIGPAPNYNFIKNTSPSTKTFTIPLTAGNIMLQNNITYLTPAYMGAVNQPVTYFTGSRNVTGTLTAYLRTGVGTGAGTGDGTPGNPLLFSSNLFSDLVAKVNTDSDPQFALQIEIGGRDNPTRVELAMPAVVLTIPTINAESVITTAINFTAQGSDPNTQIFDILQDNEIMIKYFV